MEERVRAHRFHRGKRAALPTALPGESRCRAPARVREGKDRFLFEMATGTGKTRIPAAVIELFLRTGNARRSVLFLVHRWSRGSGQEGPHQGSRQRLPGRHLQREPLTTGAAPRLSSLPCNPCCSITSTRKYLFWPDRSKRRSRCTDARFGICDAEAT